MLEHGRLKSLEDNIVAPKYNINQPQSLLSGLIIAGTGTTSIKDIVTGQSTKVKVQSLSGVIVCLVLLILLVEVCKNTSSDVTLDQRGCVHGDAPFTDIVPWCPWPSSSLV